MREIALYYPYTHVRDDGWLKAAALYWPRLARITPPGYPQFDGEVARALDGDLGFLVNVDPPTRHIAETCEQFLGFVRAHHGSLRRRYRPTGVGEPSAAWRDVWQEMVEVNTNWRSNGGGWIHNAQTTAAFREELAELDLGIATGENGEIFLVHPALSAAYALMLVDRIAGTNDLAVVTDQAKLHQVHQPGATEDLARTLIEDEPLDVRPRDVDDVAVVYADIAIRTVVPSNIGDVPVAKIVKARRKLAAEFDVFRQHLDGLDQQFEDLATIESAEVLRERLQLLVDRDLHRLTAALQRDLRTLGLEPANAVLGLKTLQLPAAAAAMTAAAGVPAVISEAGLVTARLVGAGVRARSKRQAVRYGSPAGYLLGLKQTLRRGLLQRMWKPRLSNWSSQHE